MQDRKREQTVQAVPNRNAKYLRIYKDLEKSQKAQDPEYWKRYQAEVGAYGESKSYSLCLTGDGWRLAPNFSSKNLSQSAPDLKKPQGAYDYVIVKKHRRFQIRIERANHYLLSDRANYVFAAGTMRFNEKSEITHMDDEAGSFFIQEWIDEQHKLQYKASIRSVFAELKIPFDQFRFVMDSRKHAPLTASKPIPSIYKLFDTNPSALAASAAVAVGIGVGIVYGVT